jgi:hypothetical protein
MHQDKYKPVFQFLSESKDIIQIAELLIPIR